MRRISVLLLSFLSAVAFAQEKIEADRPGETQSVSVVGKKTFQAEAGFSESKENGTDHNHVHPDLLLRFGLLEKLELRAEIMESTYSAPSKGEYRHGLEPVQLGLKLGLYESRDRKFSLAALGHVGVRALSSDEQDPGETSYQARLLAENELSEKCTLAYNFGRDWDAEGQEQNWMASIAPQFEVGEHLNVFAEFFSNFKHHSLPQYQVDGGLFYTIGKKLQLDLSAGKGLNDVSPDYFIQGGVSIKF